ncbi:NADH-quinone oxidoreductase subunit J [Flavisolibacter tropicus]|uniref:NADH-quinone oxidoreductase subunit J n=1 Tax=Flavisolibacter tropicus TaxID=1492898 RepID=A0A172TRY2_9BACT|nr:NADH-quinone oxidoreductase subunit J [Flavisolibacter tropicus]ANE49557.1 NADH:ubiquinone oxidoreductase subunit J [Flavisolibacter tropicus]
MSLLFYISSFIAVLATLMVITRHQPIHALLYLVVSFMAVSMIFLSLGAPFIAALEVILYAGAIVVLLIFVVMMLNLGKETAKQEKQWLQPKVWAGPSILALILLAELGALLLKASPASMNITVVDARQVSLSLYREYIIAVELAGFLLMAGIVGAAHIGKHSKKHLHRFLQNEGTMEKPANNAKSIVILDKESSTQMPIANENSKRGR